MARTRTGPTPAELVLMGLLTEGAAHPYSLDAKLRASQSSTEVAFSSIYAALDRLEKLGLVVSRPDAGARGKVRRVYRLTPQGRAGLKAAVREALANPKPGSSSHQLGVSNLLLLTRGEALAAISEAKASLGALEAAAKSEPESEYPKSALILHRLLMLKTEERYYAELEKSVRAHHPERLRKRTGESTD